MPIIPQNTERFADSRPAQAPAAFSRPGKFQGEPEYVGAYWRAALEGVAALIAENLEPSAAQGGLHCGSKISKKTGYQMALAKAQEAIKGD